jgi:hypothetical protein
MKEINDQLHNNLSGLLYVQLRGKLNFILYYELKNELHNEISASLNINLLNIL